MIDGASSTPSATPLAARSAARRLTAIAAVMVLLSAAPLPAPPPSEARTHPVVPVPQRIAGEDRFATAAAVSAATFDPGVPAAFVATGADFPDALAAAPAAAASGGPLLLSAANAVPSATAEELARVQPQRIVVVGSTAAIAGDVAAALAVAAGGVPLDRVAGQTRYETAAAVSAATFDPGVPVAYVATGADFPDALAGSAAASAQGGPVLLTTATALPTATAQELQRLRPQQIVVLGGTAAIGSAVESQLAEFGEVLRVAGPDRYSTAAAITEHAFEAPTHTAMLATGADFPDALAGGAAAVAARGGPAPLLLTTADCVPAPAAEQIDRLEPSTLTVLGGAAALGPGVPNVRPCRPPGPGLDFDFDTGAQGWTLQSGVWTHVAHGDGHALRGAGHGFAALNSYSGTPSRLSLRLQVDSGTVHVNLHETASGSGHIRYIVALGFGSVALHRWDASTQTTLGQVSAGFDPGVPHDIDVLLGGNSIDVVVDGLGILGVDEPGPLPAGRVSVESLDATVAIIDEVHIATDPESTPHPRAPRPAEARAPGPDIAPHFVGGVHDGNLTLSGSDELVLRDGSYTVRQGTVVIEDDAVLRIEAGAVLVMDRAGSPLLHWGVEVRDRGVLEVDGGDIAPGGNALATLQVFGDATVVIRDTEAHLHIAGAWQRSQVRIERSRLVSGLGGGFAVGQQALLEVHDSVLGHVGLHVGPNATIDAEGLAPGYIGDFSWQRDVTTTGIAFEVVLSNTLLVEDTIGEGPFERGWVLFVDESDVVDIAHSELRKLVIEMPAGGGPDLTVEGLRLDRPTTTTLRNVTLDDVTVKGQWGFFIHGSRDAQFVDCEGLWFFAYDTVDLVLIDSTMNEWDPRNYTGTITYFNSVWDVGGEIIGSNDYTMLGSVEMDPAMRSSLSWDSSTVTRHYPVRVVDAQGSPQPGVTVTAARTGNTSVTAVTDGDGNAELVLEFGDSDWTSPWQVSTTAGHAAQQVDFVTSTPLELSP